MATTKSDQASCDAPHGRCPFCGTPLPPPVGRRRKRVLCGAPKCQQAYLREYRQKNRDRVKTVQNAWNARNAEKLRAYFRDYQAENRESRSAHLREWRKTSSAYKASAHRRVLGRLGVTVDFYDRLFEEQDGRCGLCGKPPPGGRRLAVDHCHRTDRIRGLLCHTCNTSLGFIERYLEAPGKIDRWIGRSSPPRQLALEMGKLVVKPKR